MRMKILKCKQTVLVAAIHDVRCVAYEKSKPVTMAKIRMWQGEKL